MICAKDFKEEGGEVDISLADKGEEPRKPQG